MVTAQSEERDTHEEEVYLTVFWNSEENSDFWFYKLQRLTSTRKSWNKTHGFPCIQPDGGSWVPAYQMHRRMYAGNPNALYTKMNYNEYTSPQKKHTPDPTAYKRLKETHDPCSSLVPVGITNRD